MGREFALVVFDWDGTLIDSVQSIVDCTRAAMQDAELEPRPDQEIRPAIGMDLRESFMRFYPGIDAARYARVVEHYRERWLGDFKDRSQLFPGVAEMLAGLVASGHKVAIATAKSRKGLERELARTGLAGVVHATRTIDEAPPKPDPTMLLALIDELGVATARTLMVGDTTYDLDMARNAGTAAVGVLSGAHEQPGLSAAQPLACLKVATELTDWLADREAAEEVRA